MVAGIAGPVRFSLDSTGDVSPGFSSIETLQTSLMELLTGDAEHSRALRRTPGSGDFRHLSEGSAANAPTPDPLAHSGQSR